MVGRQVNTLPGEWALCRCDAPRSLTDVRVRELFGSTPHTDALEREDDDRNWVETILTSTADFAAVTRGHQFETLVPRRAAVNAVLLSLVSGSDRTNGRERERTRWAPGRTLDTGPFWQCFIQ